MKEAIKYLSNEHLNEQHVNHKYWIELADKVNKLGYYLIHNSKLKAFLSDLGIDNSNNIKEYFKELAELGREVRTERVKSRIEKAIDDIKNEGDIITVNNVAKKANVSFKTAKKYMSEMNIL